MNFEKFLENLKHHARTLALFDQHIEANVLEKIIQAVEDSLDERTASDYIEMEDESPF
jgi:hypothetical protein